MGEPANSSEEFLVNFFYNWGLILAIAGAAIALAITFTEKLVQYKKTRLILILAVFGFLIFIVQQLMQAELDKNRQKLVEDIQNTVDITYDLVKGISRNVKGGLADWGEKLVTINEETKEPEKRIENFDKGSVDKWPNYAEWVRRKKSEKGVMPCLSLTLNAKHIYAVGLVQAFLLTSEETKEKIASVLKSGQWQNFPDNDFIKTFGLRPNSVGCVLFFEDRGLKTKRFLGYAQADKFVEELHFKQQIDLSSNIEGQLNKEHDKPEIFLENMFSSVRTSRVESSNVEDIVETMLEKDIGEITVLQENQKYLVKLKQLVRLAKAGS